MRFALLLAVVLLSIAATASAQPSPGDEMMAKYLAAETDKLSAKVLDGARTVEEWKEKRPRLVREYYEMLGLWPLPEKAPLKAVVTRTFESQGALIDNLHFQSRPGLYVTANFFRPKDSTGKLPTILYVCGHSGRGRDGGRTAFQDHGLWFANNGYNCLILDTLQLGEIPGIHHGTYGIRKGKDPAETRMGWHSAGYTPAGVECWNGVRGIDYLLTRPEVDPDKIGVTGISGGGAATFWIAAADERVKVAVPVSGMSDLESYVKNKVINGHCDCMFLYNLYQWEWTTIAALVAPRPMLFANSDNDPIFPMDGNRRIIERLRKLYGMYNQPERVDEYVSKGGHAYRPDLRVAVFKFLNKHLKGDVTSPVEDSAKFKEIPGKELRAFPTDDDLPKDVLNGRIDELFVGRMKVELPKVGHFEDWRDELIRRLRQQCFRPLPDPVPTARPSKKPGTAISGYVVTESPVEGLVSVGNGPIARELAVLVVTSEDREDTAWFDPQFRRATSLLWPRGAGADLAWVKKSPPNYVERSHALLGRTVDAGRVHDIVSIFRSWSTSKNRSDLPVKVIARGQTATLCAYAALFEPSISELILTCPTKSHQEGPCFLGVLRLIDVPDALGLLAPRPLTIIGDDTAFDRTAEIYRLAGAADKLKRVRKKE